MIYFRCPFISILCVQEINAGWKPGAIPKSVRELMYHFLDPCPCDTNPVTKRIRNLPKPKTLPTNPIIQLRRHNDSYVVTMNSVDKNQPKQKPLCLMISASAEQKLMAKIKDILLNNGFKYCLCGETLARCQCRNQTELGNIYECIKQIEQKFKLRNLVHRLCFEKSKDLLLEFTPANIAESMLHESPSHRFEVIRQTPIPTTNKAISDAKPSAKSSRQKNASKTKSAKQAKRINILNRIKTSDQNSDESMRTIQADEISQQESISDNEYTNDPSSIPKSMIAHTFSTQTDTRYVRSPGEYIEKTGSVFSRGEDSYQVSEERRFCGLMRAKNKN